MLRRSFLFGAGASLIAAAADPAAPPKSTFKKGFENQIGNLDLRNLPLLDLAPPRRLVRRRSWHLWTNDERRHLGWAYRKIIRDGPQSAMKNCGLLHAAWWHGHFCGGHAADLVPPTEANSEDIHATWAFLPWHRAFIYFHERLLARVLDDDDFRLPVWEWERDDVVPSFYRNLPAPFVNGPSRKTSLRVPFPDCYLLAWLYSPDFESFMGNNSGGRTGQAAGGAHNAVHMSLAGAMSTLNVAAVDPLFYSHHANVDRFWWHWGNQLRIPAPQEFLNLDLYFYDLNGKLGKIQASTLMDMRRLGYDYDPPSVQLRGVTPSTDLNEASQDSLEKTIQARLPVEISREMALAVQFLAGIPSQRLREKFATIGGLFSSDLIEKLRAIFAGETISLQLSIRSTPKLETYPLPFYSVGLRKPGSADKAITVGRFSVFGHVPECISVAWCLAGEDIVSLLQLILTTNGNPEVVYSQPDLRVGGNIVTNPDSIGGGTTTLCKPLTLLRFQDSIAYLNSLLV